MSDWEHRRNLRLITVDEIAPSQQVQVSRWLKRRAELLIADDYEAEAESLIAEFDDSEEALC